MTLAGKNHHSRAAIKVRTQIINLSSMIVQTTQMQTDLIEAKMKPQLQTNLSSPSLNVRMKSTNGENDGPVSPVSAIQFYQ